MESIQSLFDFCFGRRVVQEGINRPGDVQAANVEIKIGQIKRETLVVAIGRIIEYPLGAGAQGGDPGGPFGKAILGRGLL